jgi:ribosomal protein L44E
VTEEEIKRISLNLVKAVMTPTDELVAKKGEGNLLVKIKRNNERVESCTGHKFVPQPDWRKSVILTYLKVPCTVCGGEMNAHDVMEYLKGFAHGSGRDYKALTDEVFPP